MDYGVVSIHKQFIGSMDYECYTRDHGPQKGTYICTLDNYHQDPNVIDYATSENPDEHKSFNLIELHNGQYALYPNNRIRIYDNSLTPKEPKTPDFKVSTQGTIRLKIVMNVLQWAMTDEYFWETAQERDRNPAKSSDSINQELK
jgi:hypothetical protein